MLTSQFCFLSPIYTQSVRNIHTQRTQLYTHKATQLNVKKNTIHEHTLPSTERRRKKKCQTNITLCATGSYRYSINILKNPHRKILENTSFFQTSSQAHFLRFHFIEGSFILSTSSVSNRVSDTVAARN